MTEADQVTVMVEAPVVVTLPNQISRSWPVAGVGHGPAQVPTPPPETEDAVTVAEALTAEDQHVADGWASPPGWWAVRRLGGLSVPTAVMRGGGV